MPSRREGMLATACKSKCGRVAQSCAAAIASVASSVASGRNAAWRSA
ncbi:hypothetical protein ACFOPN_06770 [Xanthomonas hyacinthi]